MGKSPWASGRASESRNITGFGVCGGSSHGRSGDWASPTLSREDAEYFGVWGLELKYPRASGRVGHHHAVAEYFGVWGLGESFPGRAGESVTLPRSHGIFRGLGFGVEVSLGERVSPKLPREVAEYFGVCGLRGSFPGRRARFIDSPTSPR